MKSDIPFCRASPVPALSLAAPVGGLIAADRMLARHNQLHVQRLAAEAAPTWRRRA